MTWYFSPTFHLLALSTGRAQSEAIGKGIHPANWWSPEKLAPYWFVLEAKNMCQWQSICQSPSLTSHPLGCEEGVMEAELPAPQLLIFPLRSWDLQKWTSCHLLQLHVLYICVFPFPYSINFRALKGAQELNTFGPVSQFWHLQPKWQWASYLVPLNMSCSICLIWTNNVLTKMLQRVNEIMESS